MGIGEISLHWMKAAFLYPDEFTRGKKHQLNPTLQKMKFPQEYPLTSHPNTILLVKNSQMRSIEASFKFP
jgi:hypothetical protein